MNTLQSDNRTNRLYGSRKDSVYTVSGIVHVIRNEAELPYVREGEIIVAPRIDPAWCEQLELAKAIIEDASALDSEAESIASHYDIPAVVAVVGAMELRSGDIVTLYGDGEIERIYDKRAPDSPLRVSVPAAVNARNGNGDVTAENVLDFASARSKSAETDIPAEGPDGESEDDKKDQDSLSEESKN